MLKCAIVDDEEPARLLIKEYCEKIEELEVVGLFKSPLEVIDLINNDGIDILFLDINMPDITGIDFLKSISKQPKVIITTAYRKYAVEGFELDVSDYLLKPFEFFRFLKAVNKVKHSLMLEKPQNKTADELSGNILLKSNKKTFKVDLEEIQYVQSYGEYLIYHLQSKPKLTVYGTMKSAEDLLPSSHFCRIHRSFIVNTLFVNYMEGNQVILDDIKLPIGESYKTDFIDKW